MAPFVVMLVNFGTTKQFSNYEDARAWAKKQAFEAEISLSGMVCAYYSPISGWRNAAGWHGATS